MRGCKGTPEGFSVGNSTPGFGCWAIIEASLKVLCCIGGRARRRPGCSCSQLLTDLCYNHLTVDPVDYCLLFVVSYES